MESYVLQHTPFYSAVTTYVATHCNSFFLVADATLFTCLTLRSLPKLSVRYYAAIITLFNKFPCYYSTSSLRHIRVLPAGCNL
jgi:hypothetical protein